MSLGVIFDGAAFSTKGSLFFEVLHSETIRRKLSAILKIWHFVEGVSLPLAKKKKDVTFFRRRFAKR